MAVFSNSAFDEHERGIIGQLGEFAGHAINSLERTQALLADNVTEVTLQTDALAQAFLNHATDDSATVSIDRTILLSDGHSLTYYTVDGIEPDVFVEILEEIPIEAEVRLLDEIGTRCRFEVFTAEETLISTLATYGGRVSEASLRNGEFRLVVQIPREAEVRRVLDAARAVYPDIEFVSQRDVTRQSRTQHDVFRTLDDQLTDRQRTTLEVAFYAGFFDWPRESNGEDLAELLNVNPSTVHHHLRNGERKLLSAFFEGADESTA